MDLNEHQLLRRQALEEIKKAGIDPYPAAEYVINTSAQDILTNYQNEKSAFKNISIAGRLMTRRIMGKASFAVL